MFVPYLIEWSCTIYRTLLCSFCICISCFDWVLIKTIEYFLRCRWENRFVFWRISVLNKLLNVVNRNQIISMIMQLIKYSVQQISYSFESGNSFITTKIYRLRSSEMSPLLYISFRTSVILLMTKCSKAESVSITYVIFLQRLSYSNSSMLILIKLIFPVVP